MDIYNVKEKGDDINVFFVVSQRNINLLKI